MPSGTVKWFNAGRGFGLYRAGWWRQRPIRTYQGRPEGGLQRSNWRRQGWLRRRGKRGGGRYWL